MVAFVPNKKRIREHSQNDAGVGQVVDTDKDSEPVIVARIGAAYGIKGWVKIHPFSHSPDALRHTDEWLIAPYVPNQSPIRTDWRAISKTQIKPHADGWVAHCGEWTARTAAEAVKGWQVAVMRHDFPPTDDNEYYWVDLLGAQVVNRDGAVLGEVVELLENTAQTILRVSVNDGVGQKNNDKNNRAPEYLIPFVNAFIGEVDLHANPKTIVVDWDESATA